MRCAWMRRQLRWSAGRKIRALRPANKRFFLYNPDKVEPRNPTRYPTPPKNFAGIVNNGTRRSVLEFTLERLEKFHIPAASAVSTYYSLLEWCEEAKAFDDGRLVHYHIMRRGYSTSPILGSFIVRMYLKCGAMDYARRLLLDEKQLKDAFAWVDTIIAYCKFGNFVEACNLYLRMNLIGLNISSFAFIALLGSCSDLNMGRHLQKRVMATFPNIDLEMKNAIAQMYARCGKMMEARALFDVMQKHRVAWNGMIHGYALNGQFQEAYSLYERMEFEGLVPNKSTFQGVLAACTDLKVGKKIHSDSIAKKYHAHVQVANALIGMYDRCGSVKDARVVFDGIEAKNEVSWTTMIAAYARSDSDEQAEEAVRLYREMWREKVALNEVVCAHVLSACSKIGAIEEGKAVHRNVMESGVALDGIVGTALINMYSRCGRVEDARNVFVMAMKKHGSCSCCEMWNMMIAACVGDKSCEQAFMYYRRMQFEGVIPDATTFATLALLDLDSH